MPDMGMMIFRLIVGITIRLFPTLLSSTSIYSVFSILNKINTLKYSLAMAMAVLVRTVTTSDILCQIVIVTQRRSRLSIITLVKGN